MMGYPNVWRCSCCGTEIEEDIGCPVCEWELDGHYYRCRAHSTSVSKHRKVRTPDITMSDVGFYDEDWKEITSWQIRWKTRT